jgi:hypothetical protein
LTKIKRRILRERGRKPKAKNGEKRAARDENLLAPVRGLSPGLPPSAPATFTMRRK